MQKPPIKASHELPSLDLLKGFEAAARNLSFTKAAEELYLTQSAISRQIKTLEDQLGVALFRRRHRELLLTEAGQTLLKTTAEVLRMLRDATARLKTAQRGTLTVASTISFASLWLVPRLPAFRRLHPEIDVRIAANNELQDLDRDGIDLAVRYSVRAVAGDAALRLFGESVFPVCAKGLVPKGGLTSPDALAKYVLLHLDEIERISPWLSWRVWFEVTRANDVKPAGSLRFSHYDQMIQAALDGQGIALGRSPLVDRFIKSGQLVLPFGGRFITSTADTRAYYIVLPPHAASRPEVAAFSAWLQSEAAVDEGAAPAVSGAGAASSPVIAAGR